MAAFRVRDAIGRDCPNPMKGGVSAELAQLLPAESDHPSAASSRHRKGHKALAQPNQSPRLPLRGVAGPIRTRQGQSDVRICRVRGVDLSTPDLSDSDYAVHTRLGRARPPLRRCIDRRSNLWKSVKAPSLLCHVGNVKEAEASAAREPEGIWAVYGPATDESCNSGSAYRGPRGPRTSSRSTSRDFAALSHNRRS